ncbi:MAG: pilus assembly protein PilM [Woeseiaceae bacterium]|nr:pilus assembly protein PilM [Woeseiaceae bacterium]
MSALAKVRERLPKRSTMIGPIGIDFALEAVHLVQLEASETGIPSVRARASVPLDCSRRELLDDPKRLRSTLRSALAGGGFSGRKAVVAVPSGSFKTFSINYHASSDQSDAAAVLRVMQDRLNGPLSDYVIDYLPVNTRSKNNERLALVAVAERKLVVYVLEALRKAGLKVEALEIGPVAISRLVGIMPTEQENRNVLVINSGREASYLTLISGSDLLFDQQIEFGETTLINQLAETLDLPREMARGLMERSGVDSDTAPDEDAGLIRTVGEILKPPFLRLVEEIRRVCMYAAAETRGGAVGQVYLLGSIARWPGAARMLASMADVSVANVPDPLHGISGRDEKVTKVAQSPEIAVATGLALRGMESHG